MKHSELRHLLESYESQKKTEDGKLYVAYDDNSNSGGGCCQTYSDCCGSGNVGSDCCFDACCSYLCCGC